MDDLSTKMWSILRRSSRKLGGEECNHGVECGRTGGGAGSGGRFSGARRQDLSHHRDVQSGAAGPDRGRTRRAANAAADGRPRRGTGKAPAGSGTTEEGAGGDPRARRENAAADRVDCGGELGLWRRLRRSELLLYGDRLMATATKDQVVKDAQNASVRVEIFDQAYNLRGSDPEYILKLAEYVDSKMRAVAEATNTIDTVRLAVLAALNIADEYHLLKKKHQENGATDYQKRAHLLANALDEVLGSQHRKAG